jgi:hypothetical protein
MHHDKHTTLRITSLRPNRGLVSHALSMSRALELELLQGFNASGRACHESSAAACVQYTCQALRELSGLS